MDCSTNAIMWRKCWPWKQIWLWWPALQETSKGRVENGQLNLVFLDWHHSTLSGAGKDMNETIHAIIFFGIRRNSERCAQYLANMFRARFLNIEIKKLAIVNSCKDYDYTLSLTLIMFVFSFVGTMFEMTLYFKDCSTRRLLMLKACSAFACSNCFHIGD